MIRGQGHVEVTKVTHEGHEATTGNEGEVEAVVETDIDDAIRAVVTDIETEVDDHEVGNNETGATDAAVETGVADEPDREVETDRVEIELDHVTNQKKEKSNRVHRRVHRRHPRRPCRRLIRMIQ